MAAVLLLGFSSGLPLALSGSTLQAWLTLAGVDIKQIGLFALVGLPYTLKFLWAPVMDRYIPPGMDRRRGWLLATQIGLLLCLLAMSVMQPAQQLLGLAILALSLAFLSASQDIAFDAWRADILPEKERGLGAALSVNGYRLAMLLSGAIALVIAARYGWQATYQVMAALMLVGIITTLLAPVPEQAPAPRSLLAAVRDPLLEFLQRPSAWLILLAIVLYKLGDAFAGTLTTSFLIRGAGYSLEQIAVVSKGVGLFATLFGALAGGAILMRLGTWRSLLVFGVLQAITNLGFLLLVHSKASNLLLLLVIGAENLAGGMGTAAFVALLMGLCDHRYTATQFALLSSLASVGRVMLAPVGGFVVDALGWSGYFLVSFLVALPGLWLVLRLRCELTGDVHGA